MACRSLRAKSPLLLVAVLGAVSIGMFTVDGENTLINAGAEEAANTSSSVQADESMASTLATEYGDPQLDESLYGMAPSQQQAAAAQASSQATDGFSGLVDDIEMNNITVYWKGQPPASLVTAAQTSVTPGHTGPTITIASAPFTHLQLLASQDSIGFAPNIAQSGLSEVLMNPEGTGLTLGFDNGTDLARFEQNPPAEMSSIGVPVSYVVSGSAQPLARINDTNPFKGGAEIEDLQGASFCSSGFGVHFSQPDPITHLKYFMLTADHCRSSDTLGDDDFYTGDFLKFSHASHIGYSFNTGLPTYDAMTMTTNGPLLGGKSDYKIYIGAYNSNLTSPVLSGSSAQVGDYVDVSGSFSGEVDLNQVTETAALEFLTIRGQSFPTRADLAEQIQGEGAVGPGDSGGPVYEVGSGGEIAEGINSFGLTSYPAGCFGIQATQRGGTCFWQWGFVDLPSILTNMGVLLNTQSDH